MIFLCRMTWVCAFITWQPLQTLSGLLHGNNASALGGTHLVSTGAVQALIIWA